MVNLESTRIFIQVQNYPTWNKIKFSVSGIESNVKRPAKKKKYKNHTTNKNKINQQIPRTDPYINIIEKISLGVFLAVTAAPFTQLTPQLVSLWILPNLPCELLKEFLKEKIPKNFNFLVYLQFLMAIVSE